MCRLLGDFYISVQERESQELPEGFGEHLGWGGRGQGECYGEAHHGPGLPPPRRCVQIRHPVWRAVGGRDRARVRLHTRGLWNCQHQCQGYQARGQGQSRAGAGRAQMEWELPGKFAILTYLQCVAMPLLAYNLCTLVVLPCILALLCFNVSITLLYCNVH